MSHSLNRSIPSNISYSPLYSPDITRLKEFRPWLILGGIYLVIMAKARELLCGV